MNAPLRQRLARIFFIGAFLGLPGGCAVTADGGYSYGGAVGIGIDYYEPFGFDYQGWGPGYAVGPSRGGARPAARGGERPSGHAYRSAPLMRAIPSIPSGSRSGGGQRSGGQRR